MAKKKDSAANGSNGSTGSPTRSAASSSARDGTSAHTSQNKDKQASSHAPLTISRNK